MKGKAVGNKVLKEILKEKKKHELTFKKIADLNKVRKQTMTNILQGLEGASLEKMINIAESLGIKFEVNMFSKEGEKIMIYGEKYK